MYGLSQLKTVIKHPRWLYREPYRIYKHARQGVPYYRPGIDVFEQDWDNLVILDAARYDEFRRYLDEVGFVDGELYKHTSRGATSSEFIRGNFTDRELHDTVYVSVNPHYARLRDELNCSVHDYIPLHNNEYRDAVDGLTTQPRTVTEQGIAASNKYPNKRLIVHYLQPHQPYLGSTAQSNLDHGHGLIDTIRKNSITDDELRMYYRENLDLVLDSVRTLLDELVGRTVITADHGELLGESVPPVGVHEYGHFAGMYVPELLEVPWFVVPASSEKVITSEVPATEEDIDMDEVKSHLEDLGYRT